MFYKNQAETLHMKYKITLKSTKQTSSLDNIGDAFEDLIEGNW